MPAATEDITHTEGVFGYLNVRYKAGKKFRWKKKYAVLKQDAIQLSDEKESIPDDTAELRLADDFNTCGAYSDKKAKKKHGFVLEPIDDENHEQWYFTCEDDDQQQRWMNAINDVISGKRVQKAVSCPEFDAIIVQTTSLQHLAKDRPRFHGRRLPAKKPRSENALNGIPEDSKSETTDSSQPTSPSKDLSSSNGASASAPASPASKITKEASPAVKRRQKRSTFLKGIGARVSRIFGTQPQTPRSPTSPARLDVEASPPPAITTTSLEQNITKVDEVEEEEAPENVSKDDIIKMLDFVSETTEQIVYKTVGIRGTISSVDDVEAKSELQTSWKSLRKVVNALKTTMDNLSVVEEELKAAPEMRPDRETSSTVIPPRASAPIAVDEDDEAVADESEDRPDSSGGMVDAKSEDLPATTTDKPLVGLNDSLDNVEDFEERKPSVSLMEAIEKTFNGHKSLMHKDSVSTNASGIIEEKDETIGNDSLETKQDLVEAKENSPSEIKTDAPIVAPEDDEQSDSKATDDKTTQEELPLEENKEKEEKSDEKEDQHQNENQDKEAIEESKEVDEAVIEEKEEKREEKESEETET